jgi:hypothetical protein
LDLSWRTRSISPDLTSTVEFVTSSRQCPQPVLDLPDAQVPDFPEPQDADAPAHQEIVSVLSTASTMGTDTG